MTHKKRVFATFARLATKARITTGQMCPLKQLCAPRHGGRGDNINGPGSRKILVLHIADPDKSTYLPTTCTDCKHCTNILQYLLSSSSSPGRQSVRDSEIWYVDICQRLGVAHVQVQNITGITNGTKSCIVQFALPQEPHRHCSHEDRSGVSRPVAPPKKNSPTKKSSHQFWTKQSNDWT